MNLPAVPVLAEAATSQGDGEARESTVRCGENPTTNLIRHAVNSRELRDSRGGGQNIWVFAFRVEPPPHTVMVRFGAVVLDAAMRKNEQV